jgi:dTDP-4-amino-4,6-dideoxygalactose transaminase
MIPFNKPCYLGGELKYIKKAIERGKISGNGYYSKKASALMESEFGGGKFFLTPSGTDALEMAAMICDIKEGDEVIMPSYTFVSTANAFVLRGAKILFADINPHTMNIDENKIEELITENTRAVVPVHYGGVSCEMEKIKDLADKYNILIIEDAAQGVNAKYKDNYLGTIGDIGCYSFHETKNYTSGGEGGGIFINNPSLVEKAEIIWEKGTNRKKFFEGEVEKYTWVGKGSSYLMADINAAYLLYQLERKEEILKNRLKLWERYDMDLSKLKDLGYIETPNIPDYAKHNGHMYYIKVENYEVRKNLIEYLYVNKIKAVFHYVPLHLSPAGDKYGIFKGEDIYTTKESQRLLRLPMYYDLQIEEVQYICDKIQGFYLNKKQIKL